MMKRSYLLLLTAIVIFSILAFKPNDRTISLSGNVIDKITNETINNVVITIESKDGFYEYSEPNGTFEITFNTTPGNPEYIVFKKEGYTTLRLPYTEKGPKNRYKNLSTVELLKFDEVKKQKFVQNSSIKLYSEPSLDKAKWVDLESIAYFNNYFPIKKTKDINEGLWFKVDYTSFPISNDLTGDESEIAFLLIK